MKLVVIQPLYIDDDYGCARSDIPLEYSSIEDFQKFVAEKKAEFDVEWPKYQKAFDEWYKKLQEVCKSKAYSDLDVERAELWVKIRNVEISTPKCRRDEEWYIRIENMRLRVKELDTLTQELVENNEWLGPSPVVPSELLIVGNVSLNLHYPVDNIVVHTLEEWFDIYSQTSK